eukprot:5017195-Amphidinium_carterae.1
MVKAVPGFLQVSDLWRWVIGNAVALFSGLAVCAHKAFNEPSNHSNDAPSSRFTKMSPQNCIVAGLLTGFGLDFLAEQLSGPTVDRATLQVVGVLLSSIFLPGLARAIVATPKIGK